MALDNKVEIDWIVSGLINQPLFPMKTITQVNAYTYTFCLNKTIEPCNVSITVSMRSRQVYSHEPGAMSYGAYGSSGGASGTSLFGGFGSSGGASGTSSQFETGGVAATGSVFVIKKGGNREIISDRRQFYTEQDFIIANFDFSPYLNEDRLHLRFQFEFYLKNFFGKPNSFVRRIVCHSDAMNNKQELVGIQTSLEDDLSRLLRKPDFSDFTLIVEEKKIPIHKSILSVRSSVFAAMFQHTEMQEVIQDMTYETTCHMLRYVYTGKVAPDIGHQLAAELAVAADKYDLKELVHICERLLANTLSSATVCEVFVLAKLHCFSGLLETCVQFMKINLSAIKKTDGWQRLTMEHPYFIVEHFV